MNYIFSIVNQSSAINRTCTYSTPIMKKFIRFHTELTACETELVLNDMPAYGAIED